MSESLEFFQGIQRFSGTPVEYFTSPNGVARDPRIFWQVSLADATGVETVLMKMQWPPNKISSVRHTENVKDVY